MISYKDITKTRPDVVAILIFILLHIAIFTLFFIPLSQLFYYAPGSMELSFAKQMLNGGIPYRDFTSEYPPLALLVFYIPALIRSSNPAYALLFASEMMLLDLIIVYLIADIASYIQIPVTRTLAIYTLLLLAASPLIVIRFDVLPAMLVIAALWAFIKGKNVLAWVFVALGVTAKLYPIIIAPAFGFYLLRNHQFRKLVNGILAFSTTMLAGNLPFFLMDPGNFINIITYHGQRGIQCESTYASLVLIEQILGGPAVKGIFNFGSWNITSPLADSLARIALPFIAVLLLAMYGIYVWIIWKRTDKTMYLPSGIEPGAAKLIIGYVTLAIAIFMAGNKVFSTQFLIWLIPTVPLLNRRWQAVYTMLFIIMGAITQFIFPYKYMEYGAFLTPYVLILALRNFLLILLAVLIVLTNGIKREPADCQPERVLITAGKLKRP